MRFITLLRTEWRDPQTVAAAYADETFALGLFSDGSAGARWSYLAIRPHIAMQRAAGDERDSFSQLAGLLGPATPNRPDGPPFQGGLAGLCGYELGEHPTGAGPAPHDGWPDLACGLYLSVLAFDHRDREVVAIGRGDDQAQANARAREAHGWLADHHDQRPVFRAPLVDSLEAEAPDLYEAAVASVVRRIAQGEMFQANIARRWRGRLAAGAHPIDLLGRLSSQSPAPFAAYLRLPSRALVSNSPERFISVTPTEQGLIAQTQPIKGTIARGADAAEDQALAETLAGSAKDRAENLMIVDLMRNDLARVCIPGSVTTPQLFAAMRLANVHHLVSTVTGRVAPGRSALDVLAAAFPAGSITGAPKLQAMRVIADLEPPRGPFYGAMIWAGFDGGLDSSVLIRTAACVQDGLGWRIEARAGGGIVADSRPADELAETESKFAALRRALTVGLEP